MIRYAFECGYTFFDTAEVYGTEDDPHINEQLVGEALKLLRNHVQIATKFDKKLDYRSNMPQFTDEAVEQNQALLNLLYRMAERKGATPAQISMAWMLCKKTWIVPIPGTRKPERLLENAGAAEVKLSAEEVTALDEALNHMEMSAVFGGSKIEK